jgi:serine/threonine protein kinase
LRHAAQRFFWAARVCATRLLAPNVDGVADSAMHGIDDLQGLEKTAVDAERRGCAHWPGGSAMGIADDSTVSATSQSTARLPAGTRIGPYEIVSLIGAGGMGVVYRARDSRLRRDVAIKLIPSARQSADAIKRFEIEARAAGSINHPNILSVHDVGASEHGPWLVAELLEGRSLRAALEGPLPLKRALDYARQLANGLAAAHDHGVVHRDLKPENLFVTSDERLKLLDFGIAKFLAEDAHPTRTGKIIGTPAYMSPEQRTGGEIDQRTDLYSFGAILYELLTGQRALHTGARTLPANVPMDLASLVQDCLQDKPDDRPHSARDLVARLQAIRIERPRASPRGRRLGIVFASIGLAAAAAWFFVHSRHASVGSTNTASIAVLAFANLSGDKDQEYFSDGISEELLNALATINGLKVTGRTSSFRFKGKDTPVDEIAKQLGVAYVVEGSVRKVGSRVRIAVQLIKTADGFQTWSNTFDRELRDIFAVQDEITGSILAAVKVRLLGEQDRSRAVPTNLDAYTFIFKHRRCWQRATNRASARPHSGTKRRSRSRPTTLPRG